MSAYGSTPSPAWVSSDNDPSLVKNGGEFTQAPQTSGDAAAGIGGTPHGIDGQRKVIQAHVRRINTAAGDLLGVWKPHQVARVFWSVIVAAAVLVGLPALVLHLASNMASIRVYLVLISTMFVMLAVPISLYSIRRHLLHFWVPPLQIYIVRILWMVPVYSVCTLCSLYLWVANYEPYVYIPDAFRQCYESYTLYNLFGFMIAYLEMEQGLPAAQILQRSHPTVSFVTHAPPFSLRLGGKYGFLGCCATGDAATGNPLDQLTRQEENDDNGGDIDDKGDAPLLGGGKGGGNSSRALSSSSSSSSSSLVGRLLGPARRIDLLQPWAMGDEFVKNCRRGVLFYVATMPPLAGLIVILSLLGLYHEGNFSVYSPYFWIQTFYFGTSCWALYCLALFFVVARKDLAPVKPLNKFLLVKGIVFFTWAQSVAISFALYFVYDYKARHWTNEAAKAAIMGSTSTTGGVSGIVGEIIMGDDDGGAGAYLEDDMVARAAAVQALEDERMTNAGAVCDAVMCVEMLFFAIGHAMAFPSTQFQRVMPHHTTVLGDEDAVRLAAESGSGRSGRAAVVDEEVPLAASGNSNKQEAGKKVSGGAAAALAERRALAESKQWLVEWGNYWIKERESPAGVKYRNERMFGVADVHADTAETYRLVGSGLATFAREASEKTAQAAKSTKENLDKTLDKAKMNRHGSTAPPAPYSSPLRSSSSSGGVGSPSSSSKEALASAAKDAEKRGHSTFAKLLQSKTTAADQPSPARSTVAGRGGGGGGTVSFSTTTTETSKVLFSAPTSPHEFEASDDDEDEDSGLLI